MHSFTFLCHQLLLLQMQTLVGERMAATTALPKMVMVLQGTDRAVLTLTQPGLVALEQDLQPVALQLDMEAVMVARRLPPPRQQQRLPHRKRRRWTSTGEITSPGKTSSRVITSAYRRVKKARRTCHHNIAVVAAVLGVHHLRVAKNGGMEADGTEEYHLRARYDISAC